MNGKAMLLVLQEEGHEVTERDIDRIRTKNGLLLRAGKGYVSMAGQTRKRTHSQANENAQTDVFQGQDFDSQQFADPTTAHEASFSPSSPTSDMTPEERARYDQSMQRMQAESDQKWQAGKRRRRIRGYGPLPADPAGTAARYASETSLDECKAYLQLDNAIYKQMRDRFMAICEEAGFEKKTVAGPEKWQAAKDRLVRENTHLAAMLNPLQPDVDRKSNALDVVCCDVTKRIRVMNTRISLADAKNGLELNPEQSRDARRSFYKILEADKFTSKIACGDEHWQEMRQRWIDGSPLLRSIAAEGDKLKDKYLDVLCRDASKRIRDDNLRSDPSRKKGTNKTYGPGPGPAAPTLRKDSASGRKNTAAAVAAAAATSGLSAIARAAASATPAAQDPQHDLEIDPSLLLAANDPSLSLESSSANYLFETQPAPPRARIPAYFRLNPSSRLVGHHAKMWLGSLAEPTITALHQAATAQAGAASVAKVHGMVRDGAGIETMYQIDQDDELDIYLATTGGKATFVVLLEGGYA